MTMIIPSVPEFITREQWLEFFDRCGFDARDVVEFRIARDGVHALVLARFEDGSRRLDPAGKGYYKHRIFIPTRDEGDERTARVTAVK